VLKEWKHETGEEVWKHLKPAVVAAVATASHTAVPEGAKSGVLHEPSYDLDPSHRYYGRSGVEIREAVKSSRAQELTDWMHKHKDKLHFGEQLTAEQARDYAALLLGLQEVFAENPAAPPLIPGVEFTLHFATDDPRPVCRRVPKLSLDKKEAMSKQCLNMLVNGILEFSDSDWATVPVWTLAGGFVNVVAVIRTLCRDKVR
jgi:hypothetical protein